MENIIDKLLQANELILQAEHELLDKNLLCPYELGTVLKNLAETIEKIKFMEEE